MGTVKTDKQFELCVRVHVSGDDSRAMLFIAFMKCGDQITTPIQHWQPPRSYDSRKATDERKSEKYVDLILTKFGPKLQGHVGNVPDLAEIMDAPEKQRNAVLARHFSDWLQLAALEVAETRNVMVGKVSANFAPLLEAIVLEPFHVAAEVGSFLADDKGKKLEQDPRKKKPAAED